MKTLFTYLCILSSVSAFTQQWYSSPVNNGRDVNCIKIFNHDTIIAAGGWLFTDSTQSVFKTYNSAYLWNVHVDTSAGWIRSVDFTDSQNGIAVGAGGKILKTSNGGVKWNPQNAPVNRDFNKIFFIDAQNYIIAGGKPGDSTQAGMQTILKTVDGGQTWNTVLDQPGFFLRSVYYPSPTVGYAVGDSGIILKTTDGGDSWFPVSSPIIRDFNSIWFSDTNNGIIVGGNLKNDSIQTILWTVNGGNSWTVVRDILGGWLTDVHFLNPDTGYIVGDRATLLKTIDGGQTWASETVDGSDNTEYYNTVRFYDENFGAIGGKWGRFYTYRNSSIPQATTIGAEVISPNIVMLNGIINTFSETAKYDFLYSQDPSLTLPHQNIYPWTTRSNSPFPVQALFDQMMPNTTYFYCLKAWTYGGTDYGDTLSFFTGPPYIEFKTQGARITDSSATLSGSINNFQDVPVDLSFEYGTTPLLGYEIQASPASVSDTLQYDVTAVLDSLQIYTRYYFRLKGVAPTRNYYGAISSFFTGIPYREIQTIAASNVADTAARLNGFIDGFLFPVVSMSFEYGPSPSLGFVVTASPVSINDTFPHSVTATITNLQPFTDYYFRLKVETTLETFYGNSLSFNSSLIYSAFETKTASGITNSFAQLNGYVDSLNKPASLSFEFGTTQSFGSVATATPATINDALPHRVMADIAGLQSNTTYYYRLKGTVGGNNFYGNKRQFYTGNSGIPNWDFQNWQEDTFQLLEGWNIIGDDYDKVPGISGKALKIWNTSFAILGIFNDNRGSGSGPAFLGGAPFNARPDSISAFLNYFFASGDSGLILIHLYNANYHDISTNFIKISGNSGGSFKRETFPITYNSGLMPDSIVMGFLPSAPDMLPSLSSYMIIDNIGSVPSSSPINNADFETWFDYPHNTLLEWSYLNHVLVNQSNAADTPSVSQSQFNTPTDFAAEIRNKFMPPGLWFGGELSNQKNNFSKYQGGFPINARHHTLNGFYKWLPANGDTLEIIIDILHEGQPIGRGEFWQGQPISQFTELDVTINYNANTDLLIPDTALIDIRTYKNIAKGPSKLTIDKLNFDGFLLGNEELAEDDAGQAKSINIFPNPTASAVTIKLPSSMHGRFSILDMRGSTIYSDRFDDDKIEVDVRTFKRGIYMVSITTAADWITKRFIVIR